MRKVCTNIKLGHLKYKGFLYTQLFYFRNKYIGMPHLVFQVLKMRFFNEFEYIKKNLTKLTLKKMVLVAFQME